MLSALVFRGSSFSHFLTVHFKEQSLSSLLHISQNNTPILEILMYGKQNQMLPPDHENSPSHQNTTHTHYICSNTHFWPVENTVFFLCFLALLLCIQRESFDMNDQNEVLVYKLYSIIVKA